MNPRPSHSSKSAAPSNPDVTAHPKHTRTVTSTGSLRADDLWDIEVELMDIKYRDYPLPTGMRPQGSPIHHMKLRVTIDSEMTIVHATAQMLAIPFPSHCESIVPDYQKLIGLNLMRNFRRDVARIFSNVQGCSHLSEMAQYLPTAAFQTVFGEQRPHQSAETPPAPLNGCHVWDERSAMVRAYYPRWYRPSPPVAQKDPT